MSQSLFTRLLKSRGEFVNLDGKEHKLDEPCGPAPAAFEDGIFRETVSIIPETSRVEVWRCIAVDEAPYIERHKVIGWLVSVDPANLQSTCKPVSPSLYQCDDGEVFLVVEPDRGACHILPPREFEPPTADVLQSVSAVIQMNNQGVALDVDASHLPTFKLDVPPEVFNASHSLPPEADTATGP